MYSVLWTMGMASNTSLCLMKGLGLKNTDHSISIIQSYMDKVTALHPWIQRVLLFLDNAANTNKNRYLFSWGMELVNRRKLDYVRFCFMVSGHTKFAPDRLFAQVSNSYNCHDVFTISELKDICDLHAHMTIEGWYVSTIVA